jgi:Domain of unknown function (DUF4296)
MKTVLKFFVALFLISCSPQGNRPEKLISKEKMASILINIHMAEASIEKLGLPKDSALSFYSEMEGAILARYQVDSSSFRSSFKYYASNIKDLDEIYEWVLDTLNTEQAELTHSAPK